MHMIVHMIVPYICYLCHVPSPPPLILSLKTQHTRRQYCLSVFDSHLHVHVFRCLVFFRFVPFEVLSLFWCNDSRVRVIPPRAVLRPSCVCLSSNVRRLTRGRCHVIGKKCAQQIGGLPATVEEPACMYCTCSRTEDVPCAASSRSRGLGRAQLVIIHLGHDLGHATSE